MGRQTQVLVVGGGPAGIAAAVCAARLGARARLIERYGFLGGMATAGLVNPFMGWHAAGRPLVAGVFAELLARLEEAGGYGVEREPTAFDPEALKVAADELCEQAGVEVWLHSLVVGASREGDKVARAVVAGKSGLQEWEAEVFVDCSGDADLAFFSGAPWDLGREEDGLTQPMTLNFRMGGVDLARMASREELNRLFARAKAEGRLRCPRENVLFFYTLHPDVVHFNTTRVVGRDPTEPAELTAAEVEARRQARELAALLQAEAAGFERAYLQQTAPQIGVRESRRVRGQYTFTGQDVVAARKFGDGIARSNYPIDIHSPTGEGTVIREVPAGDWYEIPYRCLLPIRLENLLVAGRCVSADHEGQAALRIMPTCFAMGQAAGTAAAMCVARGVRPRELPAEELRAALREQGQIV